MLNQAIDTRQAQSLASINAVSRSFRITARALRFYEERKLLDPIRGAGEVRLYLRRDRARLKLILYAKRLGFSLTEIGAILGLYDHNVPKQQRRAELLRLAQKRMKALEQERAQVEAALAEVQRLTVKLGGKLPATAQAQVQARG